MGTLWHVYYGTRGTGGAYIDSLQLALRKANIKSYAFVHRDYLFPTKGVIKFFFPLTGLINRPNNAIKVLRGIELVAGYLLIWLLALVMRPAINLHLAGYFGGTILFFRLCKLVGLQVYVTCHDVAQSNLKMDKQRMYVLRKANKLIVHSSSAKRLLLEYQVERASERIVRYPFPFSSYDSILSQKKLTQAAETLNNILGHEQVEYFLFIGVVRQCKGVETLIEAWKISESRHNYKLLIAGKWADVPELVKEKTEKLTNCIVLDRYLTNEEFAHFIEKSKFVVLPYLDYSHSSVLISCAKHNGSVIISDIDLFQDFLENYDLIFPKSNERQLAALLDRAVKLSDVDIKNMAEQLEKSVEKYDDRLVNEVAQAYRC